MNKPGAATRRNGTSAAIHRTINSANAPTWLGPAWHSRARTLTSAARLGTISGPRSVLP